MLRNRLHKLLHEDRRTALICKNILGSFAIKGWTGIVQLLLVPATLKCLNQYEYGVWLIISSLLLWVDTFDIGLGNGLRNRLAESVAKDDMPRARRQVSTTFFMLIVIIGAIIGLLYLLIRQADCYRLLNVDPHLVGNLNTIVFAAVAVMGATFIFKFVGNIYLALQLPAINNLLIALGHTLAFVVILLLGSFSNVTLLHVALAYTASPLLVYILSYPITFTRYKALRPALRQFDKAEIRPLFSLGLQFLVAQLSGLIIFASSNLLISHLFSPKEVTPFQIAHRYFGITNILFTVISAPFWSATTDAFTKKDWQWIRKSTARLNRVMLVFAAALTLMLLVSPWIYNIWVGAQVSIPFSMSLLMAVYMMVLIYGTCYSNIICGIGKIRLLTVVSVVQAIVYIPLALALGSWLGTKGVVMALIAVMLVSAVTNMLQFEKLYAGKAKGIWNK